MAATWSRSNGRCRRSTASIRARPSGRRPMSAGWSAIPTSSTRRCCMAARACSTRGSPSARRTPAPSGASSRSTSVAALFTAPTAFRAIRRDDPGRQPSSRNTTSRNSARCSLPASAPTRRRSNGRSIISAARSIDHWWQTETGWSICANPVGLGIMPVKYGSPGVPMPGYDLQVLDDAGHRGSRRHARQHRREAAAAAERRCRRCGTPTSASATPISRSFRATTRPPMRASSTTTATPSSWRAPTTSSTSPATGCRPARWRRCSPAIRTWRNAR